MSAYEPNSRHLREVLIFCFNMKKSAAEAHRMLSNTYGKAAISERRCREWFQRFKNGDFDVEDQHGIWPAGRVRACVERSGAETKFELFLDERKQNEFASGTSRVPVFLRKE
ncbi:mariner Mos1 transposase [Trichonephila clavipes]|nr:mariner Mos1 transposase [Trichonephila clavipes]